MHFEIFLTLSKTALKMLVLILATLFLLIIIHRLFKILSRYVRRVRLLRKVPGPKPKYPLIGNIDLFLSGPVFDTALKVPRQLSEEHSTDGLFKIYLGYKPVVMIHDPSFIEQLMMSPTVNLDKAFAYKITNSWLGSGLLTASAEKWKRDRKILLPAFNKPVLNSFLPVMNDHSFELCDKIRKQPIITDTIETFGSAALEASIEAVFGVKIIEGEENNEYVNGIREFSCLFTKRLCNPLLFSDIFYSLTGNGRISQKLVLKLHEFVDSLVTEKKKHLVEKQIPKEAKRVAEDGSIKREILCLLDLLLSYHMNDLEFTEKDVREQLDTFAVAGHATTAITLTCALMAIGSSPDVQEKLHQELDDIFGDDKKREVTEADLKSLRYLDSCIKETLRLFPPAPLLGRTLSNDLKLGQHLIPEGTDVGVNIIHVQRNEKYWNQPQLFKPERFLSDTVVPFTYLPFSIGPRNCIGQTFVMNEMKVFMANVLRQFTIHSSLNYQDADLCLKMFLGLKQIPTITFTSKTEKLNA